MIWRPKTKAQSTRLLLWMAGSMMAVQVVLLALIASGVAR